MEDRIAPDQLTDASNTRGLEEGIARNNELLEKLIAQGTDWRVPLRNGILAGLGGVLGATLLLTLLLTVLKPFEKVAPWLERVTQAIEHSRR